MGILDKCLDGTFAAYNYISQKTSEMKINHIEKKYEKEIRKIIAYCSTGNQLNKALEEKREKIIIQDELYDEMYELAKKAQSAKSKQALGKLAIIAGTAIIPNPLTAIIALGGGIIALKDGKNKDINVKYKIEIKEYNKTIVLSRK